MSAYPLYDRLVSLILIALVPATIWGPAFYTGRTATAKAQAMGRHCWVVRDPSDIWGMALTLDPSSPYRFWSNEKDPHFDNTRLHFGIILADAQYDAYAFGWSYTQMDFWLIDRQGVPHAHFDREDCRALLSKT